MAHIFLSYSRDDSAEIAENLANRLRALDHQVFFDIQSIRAGAHWPRELTTRIKWADIVIVLVTPGSNNSDYVYKEVKTAAESGKLIIPVRVQDTQLPVHLRGTWQAFTFENNNYDAILLEVERILKQRRNVNKLSTFSLGIIAFVAIVFITFLAFAFFKDKLPSLDSDELPTGTQVLITSTETAPPSCLLCVEATERLEFRSTNTLTPTRRPTLTPVPTTTQIAPGTVLLAEDFEDGSAQGFLKRDSGQWEIIEDELGNNVYQTANWGEVAIGSFEWENYSIRYRARALRWSYDAPEFGIKFRDSSDSGYYAQFLNAVNQEVVVIYTNRDDQREWERLGDLGGALTFDVNVWFDIRLDVQDDNIKLFVDNTQIFDITDDRITRGRIALIAYSDRGIVQFDDIRVTALE